MSSTRVLSLGLVGVSFLLGVLEAASPLAAHAGWVNNAGTEFQVGGALTATIVPTHVGTSFDDPACSADGGTSLAVVHGSKLLGVDGVDHPAVLVVSCLDSVSAIVRERLNFISPKDGKVLRQFSTFPKPPTVDPLPGNGWAHFVYRQDKGDLLGCRDNGALYKIDFSQATNTPDDGTAEPLSALPPEASSCKGLTWDAEADKIYLAVDAGDILRFLEGSATAESFDAPPLCTTNGLAISGGVLLVSCELDTTIHRVDKLTGVTLGAHGTLTLTLPPVGGDEPGLGGFACDPVTFHKDLTGKDLFTDALWSRRGLNGNGVIPLEFPAYTCGMPPSSVVTQGLQRFSPLAAGLGASFGGQPGAIPRAACFDNGQVLDADRDGLPDCWEASGSGVDFDGDGTTDLQLCVPVNTNGDGVTLVTECADPTRKDLFVEIDYMQDHKPDPKALSQTQSPATLVNNVFVGVKSVREAFAAAPVAPPFPLDLNAGIRLHLHVNEQVTFTPLAGPPSTSHVDHVAFTPCTGPASGAPNPAQAVDFDTIKAGNYGTATERTANLANPAVLNAKRLVFRYVLFAHNVVGNPDGGSNSSGCGEIGGDDAVITLGSFASVNNHRRGTTDQQAGTFMHEVGHLLGFGHGGLDAVNCKPNYRSVMSYTRQFAGSPIPNRRLDYSRSKDPLLTGGVLDELGALNEFSALGNHLSLGPKLPFFPTGDTTVFGPNAWSLASATTAPINWNRSLSGKNPSFQTNASANINAGSTVGCDGAGDFLEGHDDWSNILYRASAAINFAGGEVSEEMTSEQELAGAQSVDADGLGAADGTDCGGAIDPDDGIPDFFCTHRMNVLKGITSGPTQQGNIEVVIFSERNSSNSSQVWDAPAQVIKDVTLKLRLESLEIPVKVNKAGQAASGTCSAADRPDPTTGQKDGIKDLQCQFHVAKLTLPTGTLFAVVSGFFLDPITGDVRGFTARQAVTIQAVP